MNILQLKEKLSKGEPILAVDVSNISFRHMLNKLSKNEWYQLFAIPKRKNMSPILCETLRVKELLLNRIATGEVLNDKEIREFIYKNINVSHPKKFQKNPSHELSEILFEKIHVQKKSFDSPLPEKQKTIFDSFPIQVELVKRNLLSLHQLCIAKQHCLEHKNTFPRTLIELGYITEQEIIKIISYLDNWSLFKVDIENHPHELIKILTSPLARIYNCFPLKTASSVVTLGVSLDSYCEQTNFDLAMFLDIDVKLVILPTSVIEKAIEYHYEPLGDDFLIDAFKSEKNDNLGDSTEKDIFDEAVTIEPESENIPYGSSARNDYQELFQAILEVSSSPRSIGEVHDGTATMDWMEADSPKVSNQKLATEEKKKPKKGRTKRSSKVLVSTRRSALFLEPHKEKELARISLDKDEFVREHKKIVGEEITPKEIKQEEIEYINEDDLVLFWKKIIVDCQNCGARDITVRSQQDKSISAIIQMESSVVVQHDLPKEVATRFVDFMKIAADLDIENRNILQVGTTVLFLGAKKLHLQTSSFTSNHGEMLALRFLQDDDDEAWQLHIAKEAFCEKLINEEIGEPGMLERFIAQSCILMKAINAVFGVTFLYVLCCVDTIVGVVTGYITSIHRAWKAMRSVKRKMQRCAQDNQSQKLKENLNYMAESLDRIFHLNLENSYSSSKRTNALTLAIEIRGHLDNLKQDLNFLTVHEVRRTVQKNIKDFIISFIPNPVDLYMLLKDLFILGFLMKYSRLQIEGKCRQLLCDYKNMIDALETDDFLVHEKTTAKARKNLQNMLQILCNPAAFIYPAKWKKYDLLWEVKRWEDKAFMPSLELHKWLSNEVELVWNRKNICLSLQEAKYFEAEKKDFKYQYTLGKKFFNCFL
ncbi:hypothetical protein [Candidatus Uabimicrobium sp. HlEnr_7]|uniref:hypothetical protein n=1 Tax=Candidatus Uabimicrobium helgolandensis TaxID=3095367 RepID=UPI0035578D52